jgi:hypothetical protein
MDHLLHDNDADFPLIQKLLAVPTYKRMYLAHIKTMVLENFEDGSYFNTGQTLQTLIDADVQADDNKFFTYNNFLDNLDSDAGGGGGPGGGQTPGIANLMDGRSDYLLSLSDFNQAEPVITDISLSTSSPIVKESLTVTALITDATSAYLNFRTELGAPFLKAEMFDDGAHNDGSANDGIYGVEIEITNSYTQYYIYAENDDIGKFSPQRAQHEFYTIIATSTNTTVGDLVINEFMASNNATVADQDGEYDDWIELYNNGSESIDLEGYFLSDDADDVSQWSFPEGTIIDPNEYLIIWADKDEDQSGLHASFKLSASAESVLLVDPDTLIIDEVAYVDQTTDISYGRFPNGVGAFQKMNPTFGSENDGTTGTAEINQEANISVYPNPANNNITIYSDLDLDRIVIYTLTGKRIIDQIISEKSTSLDISQMDNGMHIIKAFLNDVEVAVEKLIVAKN